MRVELNSDEERFKDELENRIRDFFPEQNRLSIQWDGVGGVNNSISTFFLIGRFADALPNYNKEILTELNAELSKPTTKVEFIFGNWRGKDVFLRLVVK